MSERFDLYRCASCGSVAQVLHAGRGVPSCCRREMSLAGSGQGGGTITLREGMSLRVGVNDVTDSAGRTRKVRWVEMTARKNGEPAVDESAEDRALLSVENLHEICQ